MWAPQFKKTSQQWEHLEKGNKTNQKTVNYILGKEMEGTENI